ncbi:MAG: hypothetical protein Q4A00_03520 [Flavobacteriaceae bacterium]|nr:hypothetical protein [Flavobacteriaceae bacterium]
MKHFFTKVNFLMLLGANVLTYGQVGINEPTPQQTLDVKGTVRLKTPGKYTSRAKQLARDDNGKVVTQDFPDSGRLFVLNRDFPTGSSSAAITTQRIPKGDGTNYHSNSSLVFMLRNELEVAGNPNALVGLRPLTLVAGVVAGSRQHRIGMVKSGTGQFAGKLVHTDSNDIMSGVPNDQIQSANRFDRRSPILFRPMGNFISGVEPVRILKEWETTLGATRTKHYKEENLVWKTEMVITEGLNYVYDPWNGQKGGRAAWSTGMTVEGGNSTAEPDPISGVDQGVAN